MTTFSADVTTVSRSLPTETNVDRHDKGVLTEWRLHHYLVQYTSEVYANSFNDWHSTDHTLAMLLAS